MMPYLEKKILCSVTQEIGYTNFSVNFSVKIYRYVPYGYCAVLDYGSF